MNMCRQSIRPSVANMCGSSPWAAFICKASLYENCYNNKVANVSTSSKASTMIVTNSYFLMIECKSSVACTVNTSPCPQGRLN